MNEYGDGCDAICFEGEDVLYIHNTPRGAYISDELLVRVYFAFLKPKFIEMNKHIAYGYIDIDYAEMISFVEAIEPMDDIEFALKYK